MNEPVDTLVPGFGFFFYVIAGIGGGAGILAGRAIATTWRPWWQIALYMPIQGAAIYFLHYALYREELSTAALHLEFYIADTAICMLFGFLGYWTMRVHQMVTQYRWINVRRNLLTWARRSPASLPGATKSQ